MQKRFKIFRQLDSMDCGPTCLKMIFNYYGLKVSRDRLRNDTQITKKGVSLLGIAQTAEKYGFKTIAAKISIEQLIKSIDSFFFHIYFLIIFKLFILVKHQLIIYII